MSYLRNMSISLKVSNNQKIFTTNHMKRININSIIMSTKIQFRHHFSFRTHIKLSNNKIKYKVIKFNNRYLINQKYLPIQIIKIAKFLVRNIHYATKIMAN